MLKDLSRKYFLAFAKKDFQSIAGMLQRDVVIEDWGNCADGIEEARLIYEQFFSCNSSIDIKIINMCSEGRTVMAELVLKIEGKDTLKVVDIINFTEIGKIKSIRAYKG